MRHLRKKHCQRNGRRKRQGLAGSSNRCRYPALLETHLAHTSIPFISNIVTVESQPPRLLSASQRFRVVRTTRKPLSTRPRASRHRQGIRLLRKISALLGVRRGSIQRDSGELHPRVRTSFTGKRAGLPCRIFATFDFAHASDSTFSCLF